MDSSGAGCLSEQAGGNPAKLTEPGAPPRDRRKDVLFYPFTVDSTS